MSTSQRSLRQKPRISYFEPEEPSLDEYVFCEKCADYVFEYCSIHGALLVIPDDKVPAKPNFPSFVPRAALTIPHVFLHINYSRIPGAGLGVFTSLALPSGVRFGPYRGERTDDVTSDYRWQIYDRNNKPSHVIDASDGNKSNWMRYVNCARHWSEQNLVAFQYQGQLYYRTIRVIPRFSELMVFYGSEYANILHIDLGKYNSPKSYAQKFGAPAPKKPKFGVDNKKLQHGVVLKPLEGNNKLETTNSTTKFSNVEQGTSKNNKKCTEMKTLSGKGPSAVKKRKIEAVGKTSEAKDNNSKPLENPTRITELENNLSRESKPSKDVCKKQKKTKVTKRRLNKDEKSLGKKKNVENKLPINSTSDLNLTSINTDDTKHVDNKTANQNNFEKENISLNNERGKKYQIRNKKQNVKHIQIQDVYCICDVCKYQAVTKHILEKHMNLHDINRKFLCETCSYRFHTSLELNNHKLQRHGIKTSNVKIHECNICDYTTMVKNSLNIHLLKHTGLKRYSCNLCEYKCSQATTLKIHLRTHTREKPYSCDLCEYKCSEATTLKRHLRTHTGEKPYSCDLCEYKCSQATNLKRHLRTHTREKPYSCDLCEYKCSEATTLKRHLRTHTGEKPYSCDLCEYKCSEATTLKRHLRTHTGEKPYSCDLCEYKCSEATTLKRHLRTHTGEKPYSCDLCEYKCSEATTLKRHLRTHTGEKPYSCDLCEYKCNHIGSLNNHLKKIHLKQK